MSQSDTASQHGSLWHVTLTLSALTEVAENLRDELERLVIAHGVGLSVRYQEQTLELRYWDEGSDCRRVTHNTLKLWESYQNDLGLPAWNVVGLEVLSHETFQRRKSEGGRQAELFSPGVAPLEG